MQTLHVLVLDDDPFMLQLLTQLIGRQGVQRIEACLSGAAALRVVDDPARTPDLIFCDLDMPEMDGVEFVRELAERRYQGSLVLVTGVDERVAQTAGRVVAAHQIAVLDHLTKPVSAAQVRDVLQRMVQAPRRVRARVPPAGKRYGTEDLRRAIDRGELVNHYQPKVDVGDGRVVGAEALVRWQHPDDGLLSPDRFIDVAEDGGLIDALTHYVLAEALAQRPLWSGSGVGLAVNVSMENLSSLAFPDLVARLVADAGVPAERLTLEITESRVMRHPKAALDVLTRLRLKGFRLSMDDFGTGHSSLLQLRDLPFDQIKIDRAFVHAAWRDHTRRAIYDASFGVAGQMGIEVVAEGVEDRDDWEFLRRTGRAVAQGYFVARPMPAGELPAWRDAWAARLRDEALCPPAAPAASA